MDPKKFYLISLGCAKNTVDSESMSAILQEAGYSPVEKPNQAGILIVNTCGFIQPAREESFQVLADLAKNKKKNQLLIASGCLTERYRQLVVEQVSGINGILGTRRWMDILEVVQNLREANPRPKTLYHLPDSPTVGTAEHGVLRAAIQGSSAYLKIADGCRRPCAFCAIPLIKGTAVSRPIDKILKEARLLQDMGVKEIILIAQDTTDYGHDLGLKEGLAELLERLVSEVPKIPWIRILYAFPGYVTDRMIQVMAEHPHILPYLDIPLQHAHPQTLRRMHRPANMDWIYKTLEKMQSILPALALRTTFIVGYPGETEEEFQTLLDFVSEIKFDHLGAFKFSFEPGTTSEPLGDPVPIEVKQERLDRLMKLQQDISLERSQTYIGKKLPVLVEGYNGGISVGRSYRDAPEIDGLVFIEGEAAVGEIVQVQITGALTHDLSGYIAPNK
ncbi:MAG TPA: 30S ribosomal protein S12 methylthiotransferase RimO [Anaerolineaceae bacterium]|nr:30S ribosomal protein S12 methylthiotransferase RimO [Anaerolineaceae bacterium]